jgi:predicted amino acid dehydrogenase
LIAQEPTRVEIEGEVAVVHDDGEVGVGVDRFFDFEKKSICLIAPFARRAVSKGRTFRGRLGLGVAVTSPFEKSA